MDVSLCFKLGFIFNLLKKHQLKFSQFSLIQLMVSVGILFLIPQYFYEQSIGLELNFNKAFFLILFYVVFFQRLLLTIVGKKE